MSIKNSLLFVCALASLQLHAETLVCVPEENMHAVVLTLNKAVNLINNNKIELAVALLTSLSQKIKDLMREDVADEQEATTEATRTIDYTAWQQIVSDQQQSKERETKENDK